MSQSLKAHATPTQQAKKCNVDANAKALKS